MLVKGMCFRDTSVVNANPDVNLSLSLRHTESTTNHVAVNQGSGWRN